MSNHIKTPEEMHDLIDKIEAASGDSKIIAIVEWLEAVTHDLYHKQDG